MAGRPMRAITFAMVNVLPEPVTPSSVWNDRPSSIHSTSVAIAVGWSPAGGYGWYSWNGEPSNRTNLDSSRVSAVSSSGVSDMRIRCLGREQIPILAVRAGAGLDGRSGLSEEVSGDLRQDFAQCPMFPRWGAATKSQVIVLASESLRTYSGTRRPVVVVFVKSRKIARKKWLNPAFLPFRQAEKRRPIRYNAELGFSSMGRSFVGSLLAPFRSLRSGLHRFLAVVLPISSRFPIPIARAALSTTADKSCLFSQPSSLPPVTRFWA